MIDVTPFLTAISLLVINQLFLDCSVIAQWDVLLYAKFFWLMDTVVQITLLHTITLKYSPRASLRLCKFGKIILAAETSHDSFG